FDPGWMITDGGSGAVCARHFDNETAWLLTGEEAALNLFLGDEREGLGWHAPVYGTLVPAWTARVRHTNAGPAQFVTWVGRTAGRPRMTRHIDADGSSTVVVRTQEATSTLRIGGRGFRVAHVIERHGQF